MRQLKMELEMTDAEHVEFIDRDSWGSKRITEARWQR